MGFVLYRSSAGSGKTFTLVKEYLKLVLEHPEKFKHILAVTFTNKAAGEMKERILKALKNLSKKEDKILEDFLKQEVPQLQHIDRISSELLTTLLHNYSDFAIMTIDSFIHRVIKAFALEIGLPLNFTIDLNYEKMEDFVIQHLLDRVGKDEYITDIILKLVFSRVQEEKSWNIEADIRRFEKELFNEKNIDWIISISQLDNIEFYRFMEQLETIRRSYVETFNKLGQQALDLIQKVGLTMDDFAYKKSGPAGFLQKCALLRVGGEKNFEMGSRFRNGQWYSKSAPAEIKSAIEQLLDSGLGQISEEIIRCYDTLRSQALTAAVILDNIYLAAVVNQVKALIEEYKKENNVVPISEFNVKVYEIVKNSPVPFIYAIIGERYNHYLIDEFQDTSRLQWENLFPLIDNALGSGLFNMAVGDGKQSIYRWRGGNVEIMETDIKGKIIPEQLAIKELEKNFRSRKNIVDFNNRFFESLRAFYKEENTLLEGIYSDIAQDPMPNPGGFVSLRFIEETPTGEEADPMVCQQVKTIIDDCKARNWDYNDIAVLVRENKKGQLVAEYLLQQGIPVVSPDSLILSRIPLIRFLINALTYLNNPADKIAWSTIIYFMNLHHGKKPLDATTIGDYLQEEKENSWKISEEIGEFYRRRNYLIRMPVYEVIEELIRIFGLNQPGESLDFETSGYLQAFLDVVSRYTAENSVDLSSFLDWWEFNKEEFTLEVPENKPAIKIMTIHKAKGLEFPIVIVPYVEWEHRPDRQLWLLPDPLLPTDPPLKTPMPVNSVKLLEETFFRSGFKKEKEKVLIDNINLLYVAFTRGIDSLHIIVQRKKNNENYERLNEWAIDENNKMQPDENVEGKYKFGEPIFKEKPVKEEPEEIEFQAAKQLISNEWYSKITIRRKSKEYWRFDKNYHAERRAWGILIHQVLSNIRSIEDMPSAVQRTLVSGDIEAQEQEILEKKIRDIFEIETVKQWFRPEQQRHVFIESPIITDEGVLRPDRVMVDKYSVTIVDFKTGEERNSHIKQMIQYKNAVKAMGYKEIEAFLFYLESKEIEKVDG
ncbi:MAG: UvrD-helicase domain-containing protein [Candidatus Aminicenantes bacterium]|jgi:ATP-dependent exoDNAse (exonuclease V) beta subunit